MMKTTTLATFVTALLVVGCQSTPKGTGTANKLTEMSSQLREASMTMSSVVQTLNAVAKPEADMAKEYNAFEDAVDQMAGQASRIRSLRASIESQKADFLGTWEKNIKEINDVTLRQRSEQRRDAVLKRFDALGASGDALRAEYDKWMADVTDVHKYLETDLNPGGVQSAGDAIQRVSQRAASLQKNIENLAKELDQISDSIAAAKPSKSS